MSEPLTAGKVLVASGDATVVDSPFSIDEGTGDLRVPYTQRVVFEGDGSDSFIRHGEDAYGVAIECAVGYVMNFAGGVWTLRQVGGSAIMTIDATNGSTTFGDASNSGPFGHADSGAYNTADAYGHADSGGVNSGGTGHADSNGQNSGGAGHADSYGNNNADFGHADSYGINSGQAGHADSSGNNDAEDGHADSSGINSGPSGHADSGGGNGGLYGHADSGSYNNGEYSHADSNSYVGGDRSNASSGGGATGDYAHGAGLESNAYMNLTQARGHGLSGKQFMRAALGGLTTNADETQLTNGDQNSYIGPIPSNTSWGITATIVAVQSDGTTAMFVRRLIVTNFGSIGTGGAIGIGTDLNPDGMWSVDMGADTNGVIILVTGGTGQYIDWHAVLDIVEVRSSD